MNVTAPHSSSPLTTRRFALIPAAGQSRRMGSPKLLLPWGDTTVIEHLLATLARPEIAATVVVVRRDDFALRESLNRTAAVVVAPEVDPPDMRDSVELGLSAIRERFHPTDSDGWLLIPGDHPIVEATVLDELFRRWQVGDCQVLVPKFKDRRGHPALLRWSLADKIAQLPQDVGINQLWRSSPDLITELPTDRESVLADLDTPEEYARWRDRVLSK